MKYLKLFEDHNDIHNICKGYGIENYTINSDGSIDVDGDVILYNRGFSKLPIKFGKITGNFYCNNNKLTGLEGCPSSVGGYFNCGNNKLTSLEGCPSSVGSSFNCGYNQLTSLEGCLGCVGGDFYCNYNQLTSLEGCPSHIGGCFNCSYNKLTNFEVFPKHIGSVFFCSNNPLESIWNLFRDFNKIELFNDYDIIRDNKIIILDRLNSFLKDIGKPTVKEVEGYKCIWGIRFTKR